jgi:3-phenylpropionate/cinnamic acid dioxygenase small subunit
MPHEDAQPAREELIRRTLAEYCHFTDAGDFDDWVNLFTENGSFCIFGQSHTGHAALRAFIEDDQPPHRRGLHLTTDSIIRFDGNCARVRSNFLFVAAGDTAGIVAAAGLYHDVLVPSGDRWLFQEREAVLFAPPASRPWGPKGFENPRIVPWFAVTRATPMERRGPFPFPRPSDAMEDHDERGA